MTTRVRTIVLLVLALVVGAVVGLVTPNLFRGTTISAGSSSASVVPSAGTESLATLQSDVPVYYQDQRRLLVREFRNLPTQQDRLTTAVAAVLNVVPRDPGLTSGWNGGQVNLVKVQANQVVVDLSASAFSGFTDRTAAQQAVNQMVSTVLATVGDHNHDKTVLILSDGSAVLPILGQQGTGFGRTSLEALEPVTIERPAYGQQFPAGSIDCFGYQQRRLPSPAVRWELTSNNNSKVVGSGTITATDDSADFRRWRVTVTVAAGAYTLVVRTDDDKAIAEKVFTVS